MNTRVLIVIAVVIAIAAGWFFRQQGEVSPPVTTAPSEVDYEATDIKAVQTNDAGELEYELEAESLTHNPDTNQDEMSGITMNWEPNDTQRYRIQAGSATINQQSGDLQLSGGFTLISEDQVASGETSAPPIKVTGQALKGNTQDRQVYSEQPVQVEQGMNRFTASTMKADLESGEYEFGQVTVSFTPAKRQDQDLF